MREYPADFRCTACGKCCTCFNEIDGVLVFRSEIEHLSRHLNLSGSEFIDAYLEEISDHTPEIAAYQMRHNDGVCVFLDSSKQHCTIHDFKPLQCKLGPYGFFWDGINRYECMSDIISENWSSSAIDSLTVQLLKGDVKCQLAPLSQL